MFKLLIVDDEPGIRFSIRQVFTHDEIAIFESEGAETAKNLLRAESPDVVLLDIRLGNSDGLKLFDELKQIDPRCVVVFITGHGTADTAIEAMRRGAYDYLLKPLDAGLLRETVFQGAEVARVMRRPTIVEAGWPDTDQADLLVGTSNAMRLIFKQIGRVASQPGSVLLLGEMGTGKELVARAIYQHSDRREAPFLLVNCAGRPAQQIDGELFGYEPGAFPGAERRRIGKIEQAAGGTLLIDEIGELPPVTQVKVMRLLEENQFERLGGGESQTADVRILATSSQDLESQSFRKDLYFRLRGLTISLPPLRERPQDIPELAHYFLFRKNRQLGTSVSSISEESLERLQCYSWPGNVRELQNAIRESLIRSSGPVLLPEFLPAEILRQPVQVEAPEVDSGIAATWETLARDVETGLVSQERGLYRRALRQFDRILVAGAMKSTNGNQAMAAELLGLSRPTLRGKIRSMQKNHTEQD